MSDLEKVNKYGYCITNYDTVIFEKNAQNIMFYMYDKGYMCFYDLNFIENKLKKSEPSTNEIKRYVKTEEIRKKREAILTDLGI